MKVIPVLDVLGGLAVHAFKGRREAYRPLMSLLCETANPLNLAEAFAFIGFRDLYLADLDAILNRNPCYALYTRIVAETGLNLMVDAGVGTFVEAESVLRSGASEVIVGTETLTDPNIVKHLVGTFGKGKVIVSVDLMDRRVLSKAEPLRLMDPTSVVEMFQGMGVARVIVIDLLRVGSEQGPDFGTLESIVAKKELSVIAGGGVRNINDLERLRRTGLSGVLVATALHSGKLTMEKLRGRGFL